MKLRAAIVQLNPKFADVVFNTQRASDIVRKIFIKSTKPDLIILPELAFTGYNFHNPEHIRPYIEDFHTSVTNKSFSKCPSINWATETSKTFNCFTVVGYPEKFHDTIYNSCVLVSPSGTILFNYRKSFLYEADKVWGASENPKGFQSFSLCLNKEYHHKRAEIFKSFNRTELVTKQVELQRNITKPEPKINGIVIDPKRSDNDFEELEENDDLKWKLVNLNEIHLNHFKKTAMAICMDLSNYEFKSPFTDFEFSTYCFENDVEFIICPLAWLSSLAPGLRYKTDKDEVELERTKRFFHSTLPIPKSEVEITDDIKDDINKVLVLDDSTPVLPGDQMDSLEKYDPNLVDMSNVNFWILRCIPLFNSVWKLMNPDRSKDINTKTRHILICNRIGIEDDVVYCGSGSIIKFNFKTPSLRSDILKFQETGVENPSVEQLGSCPTGRETVLIRNLEL